MNASSLGDIEGIVGSGIGSATSATNEAVAVLGDKRTALDEKTKAELGYNDVQREALRQKMLQSFDEHHTQLQHNAIQLGEEMEGYQFDLLPFESQVAGMYQESKEAGNKVRGSRWDKEAELKKERSGLQSKLQMLPQIADPELRTKMLREIKDTQEQIKALEKATTSMTELERTVRLAAQNRAIVKLGEDLEKQAKDDKRSVTQLIEQYTPDTPFKQFEQASRGIDEGFGDQLQDFDKRYWNALRDKEVAMNLYRKELKAGHKEEAANWLRTAQMMENTANQLDGLIKKLNQAKGAAKEFVAQELQRALLQNLKSNVGNVLQLVQMGGGDPQAESEAKRLDILVAGNDASQGLKYQKESYEKLAEQKRGEYSASVADEDRFQEERKKLINRGQDTSVVDAKIKSAQANRKRALGEIEQALRMLGLTEEQIAKLPDLVTNAFKRADLDDQQREMQRLLNVTNEIDKGRAEAMTRQAALKKQRGDLFGASALERQAADIEAQNALRARLQEIEQKTITDTNKGGEYTPEEATKLKQQAFNTFQDQMETNKNSLVTTFHELRDTFKESFTSAFSDVLTKAKSFGDAIEGIFQNLSKKMLDMAANKVFEKLFGKLLYPDQKTPVPLPGLEKIDEAGILDTFGGGVNRFSSIFNAPPPPAEASLQPLPVTPYVPPDPAAQLGPFDWAQNLSAFTGGFTGNRAVAANGKPGTGLPFSGVGDVFANAMQMGSLFGGAQNPTAANTPAPNPYQIGLNYGKKELKSSTDWLGMLMNLGSMFSFAKGGEIPGRSTKDDTLIMAMGGEGILSHRGMKTLGGAANLRHLNTGRLPRFAMGGVVGMQNNVQPFHMPSLPSSQTPVLGRPTEQNGDRKITHEYNVTQIDEKRYVDEETFQQGMARSAQEGSQMALNKIQRSTNTRNTLGLR